MIAEAPVTFETEAVIAQEPETADLVPSEASASPIIEPVGASSFPKVLRRRLDRFFADQNISPKADRTMWVKIAVGLAVLVGTWIALYALRPGSWKFVALYLLGGLAQTFLLLNIAHDSNHNAISSRPLVNKTLNYVFDLCGISSYMWRILHHRGHHSCINLHGEDDALSGRGIFRFTPYESRAPWHRFQHIYALFVYALFSLDYVFVQGLPVLFLPDPRLSEAHQTSSARIRHSLCRQGLLPHVHACLAGAGAGKIASAGRRGVSSGPFGRRFTVTLVFQTTHTIDSTYFPVGPWRV